MKIEAIKEIVNNSIEYLLDQCTLIDVVDVRITEDKHYYFSTYKEFKNDSSDILYDYFIGFIKDELVIICHGSGTYNIHLDALMRCI